MTPEEVDALCENVFLESKDGVVVNYGEVVHQIVEDPAFRTLAGGACIACRQVQAGNVPSAPAIGDRAVIATMSRPANRRELGRRSMTAQAIVRPVPIIHAIEDVRVLHGRLYPTICLTLSTIMSMNRVFEPPLPKALSCDSQNFGRPSLPGRYWCAKKLTLGE